MPVLLSTAAFASHLIPRYNVTISHAELADTLCSGTLTDERDLMLTLSGNV